MLDHDIVWESNGNRFPCA